MHAHIAQTTTIILSTHILQEIEAVCDRVVIMIQGALAADDSLADLLADHGAVLSLRAGGTDPVAGRLSAIEGVRFAVHVGADGDNAGFEIFELDCDPGTNAVPAAIEIASEAGWTIASAAPRRTTLESVFAELHERQVEDRSAGAAK